jgi:hypothetical protein
MDRRDFLKTAGQATAVVGLAGGWTHLGSAPSFAENGSPESPLSLSGNWGFHLDPENVGREFTSWPEVDFANAMVLPGSTDEAGYGTKTTGPEFGHLTREWRYEGAAWYQREIEIPEAWQGQRITLFLERPHWATTVWVDDQEVGTDNSLSVPHVHDLSAVVTPGTHRLTIRIDNSYRIDVGKNAHSVTDHTQTNWNGIVGDIQLRATDPVWIDNVWTYPDLAEEHVRLEGTIRNVTGSSVDGEIEAVVSQIEADDVQVESQGVGGIGDEASFEITVPLGGDVAIWDEFTPNLYKAEVRLRADDGAYAHHHETTFGMREIETNGMEFVLNDRPVYLRGTLECCIFPETGYPPTDEAGWADLIETAQSYGLNHFRFHSWCPPKAAFRAADRLGFLLHVETPVWAHNVGEDPERDQFMLTEGKRIQDAYGNHPSFVMMALGNELGGDWSMINDMVEELKERDPRRLYTSHADHQRMEPEPEAEYYITHHTEEDYLRIHLSDRPNDRFGTDIDFSELIQGWDIPTVSHELGQWVVNPDYTELNKYTGPLKPRSLEAYQEELADRGMGDQARDMQQATGKFAWLLYKEDMETSLRTPNFGGFQLLQLQDFPGQGEALIGLLDAFWDTKDLYTPAEFRRFCSETTPLLRMEKFVWQQNETFRAEAQVRHNGGSPLGRTPAYWTIRDDDGRTLAEGEFDATDVGFGLTTLGSIEVPLSSVNGARQFEITVALEGTDASNSWDLWVYPQSVETSTPDGLLVADRLDADARRALARGGDVLVLSPPEERGGAHMETRFLPVFWSLSWFPDQPGHNSILCDPQHPALGSFPTDPHSNWQWQMLMQPSKAFVLDEAPKDYRPLVQVVDDFHRNHKLGAVFETRVGAGRLLATGLNLQGNLEERPAARQMLHSLMAYAQSDAFQPEHALSSDLLQDLLG